MGEKFGIILGVLGLVAVVLGMVFYAMYLLNKTAQGDR